MTEDLFGRLIAIADAIDERPRAKLIRAAADYGLAILQRNRQLAEIGGEATSIPGLFAAEDASIIGMIMEVVDELDQVGGTASKLAHEAQKFCSEIHMRWTEELSNVVELRRTIDELRTPPTSRLKEHPTHIPTIRDAVWAITGGLCYYCDVALVRSPNALEGHLTFHIDHLVPKDAGGPDHIANYVPACSKCNAEKSTTPFATFVAKKRKPKLSVVEGGS